jgi:ribosomal protein L11 methyltransferase
VTGRSYIELAIHSDSEVLEDIVGLVSQLGFEGMWEDGIVLRCYMQKARWSPAILDEVRRTLELFVATSRTQLPRIEVHSIHDRNWNEEWEKTLQPIHVTSSVVITPSWHHVDTAPGKLIITIDPKMSFGTGYHESTRLALRILERDIRRGDSVLDIGTGTGVLAIGAVKMGAQSAIAVDVDEWAFSNARENVQINDLGEHITVLLGGIEEVPKIQFDVIIANIQRDVIEGMLNHIRARLAPRGRVVLSGILRSEEPEIEKALLAGGFLISSRMEENAWLGLGVCIAQ